MSCRKFQFSTRRFQFDFSPLRYFHITDTNYKLSLSTVLYNHYGSRLNVGLLKNSFLSLVFYCIHLQRVKFAESNHQKSDQTRGNLCIPEVKTSFFWSYFAFRALFSEKFWLSTAVQFFGLKNMVSLLPN